MQSLCADALVVIAARTPEAFAFHKTLDETTVTTRQRLKELVGCWGWFRTWDVATIPEHCDEENSPQEWGVEGLMVQLGDGDDEVDELENEVDKSLPGDLGSNLDGILLETGGETSEHGEKGRNGRTKGQEEDDLERKREVVNDE